MSRWRQSIGGIALVLVLVWLVGFPLLITLLEALGIPEAFSLAPFLEFAGRADEWRALWQSLEGGRLVLGRNLEGVCGSLDRWTDEGKRVAEEAGHCMELWQEGKDAYGNSLPVQMSRMMYQPAPYPQRVLHTGPDTFQDGDLITITINGTEITGTMEESPADA